MRFRYFIGRSLYLFATCLLLAGCEQEAALSDQSVVDLGAVQRNRTELDEWILNTFTRPYGIEIEYRWDKNVAQNGSYTYPPEAANVKSVLETIKALWIDLYTASDLGGEKFFLGKNPVKIYMYGGKNIDGNGVELLGNTEATTNEMFLYNVNDFDPKDEDKVFILMRSVHHQFAKRLMELFPYEQVPDHQQKQIYRIDQTHCRYIQRRDTRTQIAYFLTISEQERLFYFPLFPFCRG